jgi:nicotinic acid mononucleotide adenylyltransferase
VTASRSNRAIDWSLLERAFGATGAAKLRAGVIDTPVIDISSTEIRERVIAGLSIRFLVPESVREYITRQEIYQSGPS